MYDKIARLILYRNLEEGSILYALGDIIKRMDKQSIANGAGRDLKEDIISDLYEQIHKLLVLATDNGFDDNLWHNYLAYLLAVSENPFSITCEKHGRLTGSVNQFAKNDFKVFLELFFYDFSSLEKELSINCFQVLLKYQAVEKNGKRYNKNVSEKVRLLSAKLAKAKDEEEVLTIVTDFYRTYGVGQYGLNKAFRIQNTENAVVLQPVTNTEDIQLTDLIGYELQKKKLIDNTEAFVDGRKANNVLLFGDSGTGKSTSVKAILNEYYDRGLRIVEIYKHQFKDLSAVISQLKNRNYKFIIYMDDLSFEEFEIEYKYLKAVIEGGLETKPDNILIYATSNRRHLIRETWTDRSDMSKDELHRSDTMQEKLSLVARFGITINYSAPNQKEFFQIVKGLAEATKGIQLDETELLAQANMWEMSHGGRSGRTAQQFINYLAGKSTLDTIE